MLMEEYLEKKGQHIYSEEDQKELVKYYQE